MKRSLAIVLVFLLIFSLAGCGGDIPSGSSGSSGSTESPPPDTSTEATSPSTMPVSPDVDLFPVAVPLTVDALYQAVDTDSGVGNVYSFQGRVTEITQEYALLEYRIFTGEDSLWISSPDIVCGYLYLPGEDLAELQVDQFLEITARVDAITHPLYKDTGYTTTVLEFQEAIVEQYYEVSGFLMGVQDGDKRIWNFNDGKTLADHLVQFSDLANLSGYQTDRPLKGEPITIRAKMIGGNYFDATILSQPPEPSVPEETEKPTIPSPISPTVPLPTVKPQEPDITICLHNYRPGHSQAPTCTTAGYAVYTCIMCRDSYQEVLLPVGHTFTDATCTEAKSCQLCGNAEGSPLGHSYRDGSCSRCGAADPDAPVTITVFIRGNDNKNIAGVTVTVASRNGQILGTGTTDSSGLAHISLDRRPDTYRITLSSIPARYQSKDSYIFSSTRANITLSLIPIIDPEDHSQAQYASGHTMGDFSIRDTEGKTYTLSELLKEKKLVMLNFWFCNCGPCKAEFPHFETLYQEYGNQIEILAMNHIDSEDSIRALKKEFGLSFPMLRENLGMRQGFGISSYPTTVFIGQDGTILQIQVGYYPSEAALRSVIEKHLGI